MPALWFACGHGDMNRKDAGDATRVLGIALPMCDHRQII